MAYELPSYDIDLKDEIKTVSPEANRLTANQNYAELEKYILLIVEWGRHLQLGGGVDINQIVELVRAGLKKVVTIPVSLSDGSAIVDPVSGLTVQRNGNNYIIAVTGASSMIAQIKNKSTNSVPAVELIKRAQELEYRFGVPIVNDFEVVLI